MSSTSSDADFFADIMSFMDEPTITSPDFGSTVTGARWAGGMLYSPESLQSLEETEPRIQHNTKLTQSVLPELRAVSYNRPPLSWTEATQGPPGSQDLTPSAQDLQLRDDSIVNHMRLLRMDVPTYRPFISQAKKTITIGDDESNKSYAKRVVEKATWLRMRAIQTRDMNTMALSLGGLSIR